MLLVDGVRRFGSLGALEGLPDGSNCAALCMEVWELFLEMIPGFESLLRLVPDDDLDMGSLNLDCFGVGRVIDVSGGSGRTYSPVSGSASGATEVSSERGKVVVPTKSFPDSLSLSTTEKLIE